MHGGMQTIQLCSYRGQQILVLQVMLFGIQDRLERAQLESKYVHTAQGVLDAGRIRNNIDKPLGAVEAAPKIIVFTPGAAQEAGKVLELCTLEARAGAVVK